MSLLIASLKSKPKYWGNCSRVYIMRVVKFDGELYVDMSGEQRFGAGSDAITSHVFSPEDWEDNPPKGRFDCGGSASTIQYYNDIEQWKEHCALSNYTLAESENKIPIPLPPPGWEWDMNESQFH